MLPQARISFRKPDLVSYKVRNFSTFDMHVHSTFSDGRRTVEQILEQAKRKGIGVAITDHNEANGCLRAIRLAGSRNPRFSVPVIAGMEATSSEGIHMLFYFHDCNELMEFYKKSIYPYKSLRNPTTFLSKCAEDIIDESRGYNCIVSAAHPYAPVWTGLMHHNSESLNKRLLKKIDAVEVINGAVTRRMNRKAIKIAVESERGFTAGSDAHVKYELGGVVTYVRHDCTPSEFLEHILKGDNFVQGKQLGIMKKAATHASKFSGNDYPNPISYIRRGIKFVREERKARKTERRKDSGN